MMKELFIPRALLLAVAVYALYTGSNYLLAQPGPAASETVRPLQMEGTMTTKHSHEERALLAGGCFWGVEELIRKLPGVKSTRVGYTGGEVEQPTYEVIKTGTTGHAESIEVVFDPQKLRYEALLRYFFRLHDPTTMNQQGNDRGTQYRSAIFYLSDEQKQTALQVRDELERSKKWKSPIVTEITPAKTFYAAEEYHQDYLQKNPHGYTCHYLRD